MNNCYIKKRKKRLEYYQQSRSEQINLVQKLLIFPVNATSYFKANFIK